MKINKAGLVPAFSRGSCYGLIFCLSLILAACGGSTSTTPDIGAAQEQSGGDNATNEPDGTVIPQPGPGTGTPTTNPGLPLDVLRGPVALTGSVTSYPESETAPSDALNNANSLLDDESSNAAALTRTDMRPVQALVSLFLLSDVNFETPVATVKSDSSGVYTVTADDVKDYLVQQQLIVVSATDEQVLTSFRALGHLQVRALIVKERNGIRRAMAIQSLADPADVDASGAPVPVAIDPIAHRVVKVIVNSIRESVTSLESMGLSPTVIDQLIDTVVQEVVTQIDQILDETADEVIEIPDGLTIEDVIVNQEEELELAVAPQQLDQLAVVLDGTESQPDDSQLLALEGTVSSANEIADAEQSTLESSLNSESQGLLSGFESSLSDQLTGSVEQRISEAREVGTDEALSAVFAEDREGVEIEQALAAIEIEQEKQSRLSIQRFFLSLGVGVVVDENQAGDAAVVALQLPLPYYLDSDFLPGAAGLGERDIRLFKVGNGELDADSDYTSNPFVQLGIVGENAQPMPPFKYIPALDDVAAQMFPGMLPEAVQQAVDEASERLFDTALTTAEDYQLIDRVSVLHELRGRLQDSTLVSANVIDMLVSNRSRRIPLKRIAAAIAQEFQWVQDDIKLTPDGFPIYSGRSGPLAGGATTVDSSELVRALSITLGESAVSTVKNLTESDGFLAQFAPNAVELALQRFAFDDQTDLTDALLEIYPREAGGYRDLIIGAVTGEPEPEYARARDRVARGLSAAIPAGMYGQTLTSESEVNIRSALFFLDYTLRRDFPVDANQGFYEQFVITSPDGIAQSRFVPAYSNVKTLEPVGQVSVAAIMSELLNITAVDDGELFRTVTAEMTDSLRDIPELPGYQEHSVDNYIDDLGPRVDSVDAVCAVEMFDGTDPDNAEEHRRLNLAVFEVDYIDGTGERLKGNRVDATITSELTEVADSAYRVYRISGLPTVAGDVYGRDYVLRFDIDSYQNELPELHFYIDGFVPENNLCDLTAPLYIGPDQELANLPGVGLVSNQTRYPGPDFIDSGTVDVDGNGSVIPESDAQFEWIDLSNFEIPGASIYVTAMDEADGIGAVDFRLQHEGGKYTLVGPANSGTGFAQLFGTYIGGELQLSLQESDTFAALYGLQTVVGASARDIIGSVTQGEADLSTSLLVADGSSVSTGADEGNITGISNRALLPATQLVLNDDTTEIGFDAESLYLFKDREGRFWVIALRYFESFIDYDGSERAVIDIGVASVNNIGLIDVPNITYDNALPDGFDKLDNDSINYYSLYYGDWLVLENPTDYTGADVLPPKVLAFTASDDYSRLSQAIDGIVLRYAGDHFSENIARLEDIDARFGTPPDFSKVPVRLDAGRAGITFVKLAFDLTEKRYVMDPMPQDAASYVTQLNHNDLIAIFDDQSASDGPVYLARVIRNSDDASINGNIGIEVMRYDTVVNELNEYDEREVICFLENEGGCPDFYPLLYSAADAVNTIGIVYDNDVDGVPALFDPNDHDPYIPGFTDPDEGYPDYSGPIDSDDLIIESVAGVGDDGSTVRALIARTNYIYPGDIDTITLQSELFGADSPAQVVLSCEPPVLQEFGLYSGVRCTTHSVADDIELEIFRQSEQDVSMVMIMAPQTLTALGNYVEFSYEINFRDPLAVDGQPLICGTAVCPGRPASSGVITVPVSQELPVHGQVLVQVQGQEPMELLGLRELDVDREIRVSAAALPGAVEYELTVYCPASSQYDDYNTQDYYQPEEFMNFFAPSRDELGLPVPPEFNIHIPWLAGRECRVSLRSYIETEAGERAGISLYVQGGVSMIGSADGGGFTDNEASFKTGDSVCIEDDLRLTAENCPASESLFTVQSLDTQSNQRKQVSIGLSENVINAHANGYSKELLQTRLSAGASVRFDGIALGESPTCAELASPLQSDSSCEAVAEGLQTVFTVSDDGEQMQLQLPDIIVEGPLNEQGNISLTVPGYYHVIHVLNDAGSAVETVADGSDGGSALTNYRELMNIMVDVYDGPTGEPAVFARFENTGFSDFLDNNDEQRELQAAVPGHIFIQSVEGHNIDMEVRTIVDDHLKVTFHINQPMKFSGTHDLNGDEITDIEIAPDDESWQFRFGPTVDGVRDFGFSAEEDIPVDASGYRVVSYPIDQGFAELLVRIGDTEYMVIAEFHADGLGNLQVVDQYPIAEESLDPLFDGRDFEHYFPVELSAASPFMRDQIELNQFEEPLDIGFTDGAMPEEGVDGTMQTERTDAFFNSSGGTSGLLADAERIAGVLAGRFKLAKFFRAGNFRGSSSNASCFGPALYYQNHPDGADVEPMIDFASGEPAPYANLPSGDLGIWTEYDQTTGNACAAAQMNAQLDTARHRTFAGLVTLASVVRRLTPEQQADVLSGAQVSVVERMNALSLPAVTFEQASVSLQADTGQWNYSVGMTELAENGDESLKTSIEMNFNPGSGENIWDYSGAMRFRIEDRVESSGCTNDAVEHLSSLAFERVDQAFLKTEYRYGRYCGHDGVNGFDDHGLVDPTYSSLVANDGWMNNFSIFAANVNPYSGAGSYAYSWQAGPNDSHSRVLNVGLNDFEPMDGEAWYGYGQSLINGSSMAGNIAGFICNWAGPGNDHALLERAQRQTLVYDGATDTFVVPEGGSNITYAPTVACTYNSDDGGSFLYDRDLDGALGDESADSVDVGGDELLPLDLAPPESSTYFGLDIDEVIQLQGFTKPESPVVTR